MQTLTSCNATFMSTRTAAGQFKGQFKGPLWSLTLLSRLAGRWRLCRIQWSGQL